MWQTCNKIVLGILFNQSIRYNYNHRNTYKKVTDVIMHKQTEAINREKGEIQLYTVHAVLQNTL